MAKTYFSNNKIEQTVDVIQETIYKNLTIKGGKSMFYQVITKHSYIFQNQRGMSMFTGDDREGELMRQ